MKDPVCGMTVEPASAAGSHTHAGQTYYFCSKHCLERFAADPARFLAPAPSSPPRHRRPDSGPARCIPRSCATRPAPARSAAWRSSRASRPPTTSRNPELADMTRRFWVSVVATVPLLVLAMGSMMPGAPRAERAPAGVSSPGSSWRSRRRSCSGAAGRSSCAAGDSVVNRSPNMFTLIGLGVGVAYVYSVVAVVAPGIFPAAFRDARRRRRRLLRAGGGDRRRWCCSGRCSSCARAAAPARRSARC